MILKQSSLMRFTAVGNNGGDYIVANSITRIYEYMAPVNGVPQGNFANNTVNSSK
jgi:hypothetical protein